MCEMLPLLAPPDSHEKAVPSSPGTLSEVSCKQFVQLTVRHVGIVRVAAFCRFPVPDCKCDVTFDVVVILGCSPSPFIVIAHRTS